MVFDPGVWLLISCFYGLSSGYCVYGDDPKCAFQCRCAVDSECSGGTCPSGCDTAPLGHNWRGPACQIGNVGLHKPANMTAGSDYNTWYPPTAALDGVSPGAINSNCAHPAARGNNPAEWWTDLGDVYKIYNITIYGRTDGGQEMLKQFELKVYNTSDSEALCAYHHDAIYTHNTITCTRPVIGRYVHFKRTGGADISQTALCEVVIIGHKYIDCTGCPDGVTCNDVTGCIQCSGSYPPDCKTKCENGYYGPNCQKRCGHCKDGVTCDDQNGRCHNGCQLWWADDRCDRYLDKPNGGEKSISVKNKTQSSIEIEWQQLTGISDLLKQYYGYLIQYKEQTTGASYIEAATVNYTSSPYRKIENLKCYTGYSVKIQPFRMFENKKDYGSPYPVLRVKTSCGEPESPNLKSVRVDYGGTLNPRIILDYEELADLEPHCVNLSHCFIEYKAQGKETFLKHICDLNSTSYTFSLPAGSVYELRVTVFNNEGHSSSSKVENVEVLDSTCSLPIYGIAVALVMSLIINITLAILLWKFKRQQAKSQTTSDNLGPLKTDRRVGTSQAGRNREHWDGHTELSPDLVDYELVPQNTSTNQHNLNVEPVLSNRNAGMAEYEDIKGQVSMEKSQNTYEGLCDEARAVYENRMVTGPYAELQK